MISLKNTLEAIGNKISAINSSLGNVPHRTLLWTNPNPTASFSAQTISLDLSNYDDVEIVDTWLGSHKVAVQSGSGTTGTRLLTHQDIPGQGMAIAFRQVYANQSTVAFEVGVWGGIGLVNNQSVDNSVCVPYKIYGIKWGGIA